MWKILFCKIKENRYLLQSIDWIFIVVSLYNNLTFPVRQMSSSFNREKKFQGKRVNYAVLYILCEQRVSLIGITLSDRRIPIKDKRKWKLHIHMSQAKENRISRDPRKVYEALHDVLNLSCRIIRKKSHKSNRNIQKFNENLIQ